MTWRPHMQEYRRPRNSRQASAAARLLLTLHILAGLFIFAAISVSASAASVGFDLTQMPRVGKPALPVAFWYPTPSQSALVQMGLGEQNVAVHGALAGANRPLIIISHGAEGTWSSHSDTAAALVQAGFVVAALTHDDFAPDGGLRIQGRASQLGALISFATKSWRGHASLDPERIGAFGFSLGGFATLVAAGGKPNPALIAPHCKAAAAEWSCRHARNLQPAPVQSGAPRIKAAVIAVPALGYVFGKAGLADVRIPIQLWQAANDHTLARPWSADAVRDDLPTPPEYHLVQGADHADFVAPCTPDALRAAPKLCRYPSGFDRDAFHKVFDYAVTAFFVHWLTPPR